MVVLPPIFFLLAIVWYVFGSLFYLQASSSSHKLVVYNLNNYSIQGNLPAKLPAKSPASLSAIEAVLQTLQPDILSLTEMGSREDLLFLQKQLKSHGLLLPYAVWINATDPVRHLALLSRFPIERNDSLLLVPTSIPQLFVKRGIMDISLRLENGSTLRIVGLHLKSRRPPIKTSRRVRYAEAQAVSAHIASILHNDPKANLLVVGDFNDHPTSPTLKAILLQERASSDKQKSVLHASSPLPHHNNTPTLVDLVPTDKFGVRWTHYFAKDDIYSRLDYLLASSGIIPKLVEAGILHHPQWNLASDHRPLYISISFPP